MTVGSQSEEMARRSFFPVVQATVVVAVCVAFYSPIFPPLIKEWYEHENFSYGFLIPFIFLYLIWEERALFKENSINSSPWGAISFLSALLVGLGGKVLGEPFISRVSFVLAIASLVHLFWGWYCVKRLAFPLGFLLLMVPPPYVIVKEVSYYLRMSDAFIANHLVQAVGVPVYRDAYMLHLPNITLEVADVCSGIASLFAMLALGTVYVYYLPTRTSMKFAVLVGAFIFPMIANLFRIFLVTVSVYYYGPVMLQAFFHHFTGTFTFLLSLVMLLWLGETVRRRYPKELPPVGQQTPHAELRQSPDQIGTPRFAYRVLAVSISGVIIGAGLLFGLLNFPAFSKGEGSHVELEKLSSAIGAYRMTSGNQADSYADPHAEKTLLRFYESPDKKEIELFVGYNSRQFDENRLQSPKLVFPKGWEYASLEEIRIPTVDTKRIDAGGLLTKKSMARKFVLFWYEVRGQSFASDVRNRIELMKGLALHGRTDGAVIRLATPVGDFEPLEQAKNRLVSFSIDLYPQLLKVLPN